MTTITGYTYIWILIFCKTVEFATLLKTKIVDKASRTVKLLSSLLNLLLYDYNYNKMIKWKKKLRTNTVSLNEVEYKLQYTSNTAALCSSSQPLQM